MEATKQNNDGRAAFPLTGDDSIGLPTQNGMSLREYFAAKAMQTLISLDERSHEHVAVAAYKFADAMLAAGK